MASRKSSITVQIGTNECVTVQRLSEIHCRAEKGCNSIIWLHPPQLLRSKDMSLEPKYVLREYFGRDEEEVDIGERGWGQIL